MAASAAQPAVSARIYQLTCPLCGHWLVEWTPAPNGIVRARCNGRSCRHSVRFAYDAAGIMSAAVLPRDLFSRVRDWFLWLQLPLRPDAEQIVTIEGCRYRVHLEPVE